MFQNLPNTREVQKAQYELGQMMEDKYNELKSEGKSENEAIGIVISEFGNLEELAADLGIDSYIHPEQQAMYDKRNITQDEAESFIADKQKSGVMTALGVLLCIMCVTPFILLEYIGSGSSVLGLAAMFGMIAIAIGFFVFSKVYMDKWSFLNRQSCSMDFSTTDYVHHERENYRMTHAVLITVGVMLCVLSFVPAAIMDELDMSELMTEGVAPVILFAMIAVGVFFFIVTGNRMKAYNTLLSVNERGTMGGSFVDSQKEQVHYDSKTVSAVMSVYWPTVTCIYLCWSFLTMDWHITWVVWVIASLVEMFIKNMNRDY
ncbi:MAG: hypothetical protein IJ326_10000 [Lachnospiraceae bacterium]|nr:hypothetical protein [Lachnospiraceae bacterium]